MNSQESTLIAELFDRISKNPPQQVDSEAERLIAEKVAANPQAAYVLTQSTIILQQAVTSAQARISALEKQIAEASSAQQSGGFLSGVANLFGTPQPQAQPAPARPVAPPPIPQQAAPAAASSAGGGFLQNAAATAAGVAGGALLFQGIQNLFGHGGGFGGGGFGGGSGFLAQNQPTEVINNYYMDDQTNDQNSDEIAQNDDLSGDDLADNDFSDGGGSDFFGGGDDLV
jgi:hypothetical protein